MMMMVMVVIKILVTLIHRFDAHDHISKIDIELILN